jgi:hypothetical protein
MIWLRPTKYVHIKSTTVYAPRRNWDSPQPPTRRLVCPLPPVSGGRGTLAGEKEVGRVPIPTWGIHCETLYMYVLCAPTPPPPLSRKQVVSRFQFFCATPVELSHERGDRDWGGASSYDGEKAWSSMHHSILSGASGQTPPPPHHLPICKLIR